ncbi:MAG TPA: hypothetical protein VN694_06960 [Caulobacteraceae bacterium]|nr:hypothetical protein [Caulobacteraceae bacterium]
MITTVCLSVASSDGAWNSRRSTAHRDVEQSVLAGADRREAARRLDHARQQVDARAVAHRTAAEPGQSEACARQQMATIEERALRQGCFHQLSYRP